MNNTTIGRRLRDHAAELELFGRNLYRVRAYRRAAAVIAVLPREVQEIVAEGGEAALRRVPGIGEHLAFTLVRLLKTGTFETLGPLPEDTGADHPTSLPGIGTRTALRLRDELGVETVEDVDRAAREGRLEALGVGPKRLRGVLSVLKYRKEQQPAEPPVEDILAVDAEYRTLATRREGTGVPVLQTTRDGWRYHATFSASPLAFRLGQTRDWVVIAFKKGETSGQRIVVTETKQHLRGRRVVRGRERECDACWAS